jgi:hypothetical protein
MYLLSFSTFILLGFVITKSVPQGQMESHSIFGWDSVGLEVQKKGQISPAAGLLVGSSRNYSKTWGSPIEDWHWRSDMYLHAGLGQEPCRDIFTNPSPMPSMVLGQVGTEAHLAEYKLPSLPASHFSHEPLASTSSIPHGPLDKPRIFLPQPFLQPAFLSVPYNCL